MFRTAALLTIAASTLCSVAVRPSVAAEPRACREDPKLALLEFWLGEWTVAVDYLAVGANRIELALDGCAIIEHWQSTHGGRGMSLFYLAPDGEDLKQVWVTSAALEPGGTKEKTFVTQAEDGTLVFQGIWWDEAGREIVDRTRLTPLSDGTVRQRIEVSADAGQTWTTTFDAVYSRVPASR